MGEQTPYPEDEGTLALTSGEDGTTDQAILDRMARFRKNPVNFAREISLFIRGVGWRSYDNIVGQPAFYPGYTERVKTATMSSTILRKKLEDLTEARLRVEEDEGLLDNTRTTFEQERYARRTKIYKSLVRITNVMVDKMMCKMESKPYIRSAFYTVTQLLTRAYSGVHVSKEEVARLRKVAAIAAKKNQSIIFLPRHSSHIDYVALQLICYRLGLTLPIVVAGDNLNFPLVGGFLQSCGAMWIRRSFAGDQLYTTLVQAYLDTLLQLGYNVECFIEGTRSRTGKLLGPRFGILSFLLDSVLSGRTEDAYICPVSLQYDKVIEVDSYVNELLGKPKQKENLGDFVAASSILSVNFGRIDCRFHEPWSLREFINEQQARADQTSQVNLAESSGTSDTRIRLLRTLGYKVLSDINSVAVVMPTAIVGTVLLTLRGRGVGKAELIRRFDWLVARVKSNGGKIADFHGMSSAAVIDRALNVLGPKMIGTIEGLAEETYYAVDRFQLSFYRNMTIHLFISEALIATALYTKVKRGGGSANERISPTLLTEKVTFLSQLFRGEFVFPAGQGLQRNLEAALYGLLRDDVLVLQQNASTGNDDIGLSTAERESGRENFDFYCFLLWPFCDAAWLGVVSLYCLVPPIGSSVVWLDLAQAQETAQQFGRTLYHQGDLSYFEAINKEALKNAYTRCQEEGIIQISKTKDSKARSTIRIAPDWMPEREPETGKVMPSGRLWGFIERIAEHRREGKNRRDGATVSRRVLDLAAKLNEQFFEVVGEDPSSDDEAIPAKSRQRRSKL